MTTDKPPVLAGCAVLPPMKRQRRRKTTPASAPNQKSKGRDRFKVLNNFVDFTMRDLKGSDVRVWFVLYRDTKDGTAETAQTDIARRAGVSVRAVHGSVKRLQRLGLVKVIYRGGLNRGSSRYRVLPLID